MALPRIFYPLSEWHISNCQIYFVNRVAKSWIQVYVLYYGFLGGTSGKESACQCRRHKRCGFHPWIGKIPWRRKWQPIPVFLPGKSHGQRRLAGYSPWDLKSQTQLNDWAHMLLSLSCSESWLFKIHSYCLPQRIALDQLYVPSLEGYDPFPWWAELNQWVTVRRKGQSSGSRWVTLWCSPSFH